MTDAPTAATTLDGQVAIVTGGGSGIGAALVGQLSEAGASVLAADVDVAALGVQAAATGCATREVDVSDLGANQAMVGAAVDQFGRLDLAFLNAGMLGRPIIEQASPVHLAGLSIDRYRAVVDVNLHGVTYGTLACAAAMRDSGGGAIVATASAAGLVPWSPDPFYTITKHGVVGWVRSIAPALQADDISIDAICPGGVATPLVGVTATDDPQPHLLSAAQVAEAMIATALEEGSGRAVSVVAGRDEVRQVHEFNPIPGFDV